MKATFLDLRRNPRKILEAIERNETITLSKRGREIAYIVPKKKAKGAVSLKDSPAFGMWKDRADMADPAGYVRRMRKGRFSDF
ncbi:MAG TPA: type II toxin-antitoxin system prevent-host-death family antitoxin [Candidatus Hydrogenedentes bacterium]|nr:type II toxin-antitoxin system prevent-host-death family antitoxin [Candidatus Hydrogenedentota bacterium]HIJ73231.1 type II toxin-antitoxin system prevent-host-death family antitoxin [Candidatus Hydrogenedentota bacterium]